MSKGEEIIEQFLIEEGFEFIREYSFSNLKCKNPLRYDFYIPKYKTLIEYDGEQHFKENNFFISDLAKIQYRDNLKDKYVLKHGLKLIRIPYDKLDIITPKYLAHKIKIPKFYKIYNLSNLISCGPY